MPKEQRKAQLTWPRAHQRRLGAAAKTPSKTIRIAERGRTQSWCESGPCEDRGLRFSRLTGCFFQVTSVSYYRKAALGWDIVR